MKDSQLEKHISSANTYSDLLADAKSNELCDSWLNEETVDYWRHFRMISPLKALFSSFPNAHCVTIGDGRFGLDSIKLKKLERSLDVFPTDLHTDLLVEAKRKGIIEKFGQEDAEHLSFEDNSFDFSVCIESFHHFPRPHIALYEMIRISKKAVILVEPNEVFPKPVLGSIIRALKNAVRRIIGRKIYHHDEWRFEESGNYIFSTSKREMEKVALSLGLSHVAFCHFNDYYEKGVEFENAVSGNKVFKRVKNKIAKADFRSKLGLQVYSGIIAIILTETPSQELQHKLKDEGFDVVELPVNPYV